MDFNIKENEYEAIAHEVAKMVTSRYLSSMSDIYEKKVINSVAEFYTEAYLVAKKQAEYHCLKLNKQQTQSGVAIFDEEKSPFKESHFR